MELWIACSHSLRRRTRTIGKGITDRDGTSIETSKTSEDVMLSLAWRREVTPKTKLHRHSEGAKKMDSTVNVTIDEDDAEIGITTNSTMLNINLREKFGAATKHLGQQGHIDCEYKIRTCLMYLLALRTPWKPMKKHAMLRVLLHLEAM
jgi:hypothetical protein